MSKNKKLEERKKRIAAETAFLKKKGYTKCDISISANKANFFSIFTPLPFIAALVVAFGQLYGWNSYAEGFDAWANSPFEIIIFIAALLASLVIHELIHGLFFGLTTRSHFKYVEFGMLWKSLNPYCSCTEAISKPRYLLTVLAPGFILGICVGVLGVIMGNMLLFVFGIFNIASAGGDMYIALTVLKFSRKGRKELYLDHPEKPGSIAFTKGR